MIENHTNWSLSRLLKVRAPLAYRSVLSGVALVQLPLVHHDADKSTVLVDYAKQCPLSTAVLCMSVGLLLERRQ